MIGAWSGQLALYYLTVSFLSFVMYWVDKRAAAAGRWRVPENRLHLLDLIGGWPGGLAAQIGLRHKTRKRRFRIVFWSTVALHISILGCLLFLYASKR